MRAASAKAVSFFDASVWSNIILVKFTNCMRIKEKVSEHVFNSAGPNSLLALYQSI
jgi:hypothetical protein